MRPGFFHHHLPLSYQASNNESVAIADNEHTPVLMK